MVCVFVSIWVFVSLLICVYVFEYRCVGVCVFPCVSDSGCVCVFLFVCLCLCVCVCICVCVCAWSFLTLFSSIFSNKGVKHQEIFQNWLVYGKESGCVAKFVWSSYCKLCKDLLQILTTNFLFLVVFGGKDTWVSKSLR